MAQNATPSATAEVPVTSGCSVYDSDGSQVGMVDDVGTDQESFDVRQAGLGLGSLGGEFVVPRTLVASARQDGITLNVSAEELEAHRVRRN